MQLDTLKKYSAEGFSHYKIAKLENVSPSTIQYWLKKYKIKTHGKAGALHHHNKIINWSVVQKYYNDNHSRNETLKHFKMSAKTWVKGVKNGHIIQRSNKDAYKLAALLAIGRKHSKKTKMNLSKARKAYLKKTGKEAWKNIDKHRSVPCEYFKKYLTQMGFEFESEWMPLYNKNKFFRIDISFPYLKFGIEINGRQHYDSNGKLLPYYQKRHNLITRNGWKLLEIPSHYVFSEIRRDKIIKMVRAGGVEPTTKAVICRNPL